MPCHPFRTKEGASGFICTGRSPVKKCLWCTNAGTQLCDYKLPNGKDCDARCCKVCAEHVGEDKDFCPNHRTDKKQEEKKPMQDYSKCRSCGASIVWMLTKNGKNMPVDSQPGNPQPKEEFNPSTQVSHFKTCPNASSHSKATKKT